MQIKSLINIGFFYAEHTPSTLSVVKGFLSVSLLKTKKLSFSSNADQNPLTTEDDTFEYFSSGKYATELSLN